MKNPSQFLIQLFSRFKRRRIRIVINAHALTMKGSPTDYWIGICPSPQAWDMDFKNLKPLRPRPKTICNVNLLRENSSYVKLEFLSWTIILTATHMSASRFPLCQVSSKCRTKALQKQVTVREPCISNYPAEDRFPMHKGVSYPVILMCLRWAEIA